MNPELSVIQKTYDLVLWFIPILNRLPRDHKFALGDRMIANLYDLLEGLVTAQYSKDRRVRLEALNGKLDVLRYQVRLCADLKLMDKDRYAFASKGLQAVGNELGGWLKQQRSKPTTVAEAV
jgi:hypothetical protein